MVFENATTLALCVCTFRWPSIIAFWSLGSGMEQKTSKIPSMNSQKSPGMMTWPGAVHLQILKTKTLSRSCLGHEGANNFKLSPLQAINFAVMSIYDLVSSTMCFSFPSSAQVLTSRKPKKVRYMCKRRGGRS